MIEYRKGNILECECEAITNTVNCVGVMGKGLALAFKNRYPAMFEAYKQACDKGEVKTGYMWLWTAPDGKLIINFPTKDHWKFPSQKLYLVQGLADLHKVVRERNIKSLALPALGCNNGGLEWPVVRHLLESFSLLMPDDLKFVVYEPLQP